jgi:hypothetical protein
MSRNPKGAASADAAITAADAPATVDTAAAQTPATLDAADYVAGNSALDHDGDGKPGGAIAAGVLLKAHEGHARGVVVTGSAAQIRDLIDTDKARNATDEDIRVAGRHVRAL